MAHAMDFFEHQELARKRSGRLIALFALAVVSIVVALYAVGVIALTFVENRQPGAEATVSLWNPWAGAAAIGLAAALIGGGTAYKLIELRSGGRVIAEHLGGTLLSHDRADLGGQRLLNVVEEMAIASGVPVPPVYLLENEDAINAFAAGYDPDDAVIGVTRGAVDRLSRDQLQGVIAHEFSHILSGDMRINLRLVGVLHGILLLGLTGLMIMRGLFYAGGAGGRRSSGKNQGGAVLAIIAFAAALTAIGYIGVFFGNWIKAALSRQREFLADASAVQFTRNPEGIAGALRVLGGTKKRAKLRSPNAPEASHMFFGNALSVGFGGLLATHPPLEKRIKRIDPSWDGSFIDSPEPERAPTGGRTGAKTAPRAGVSGFAGGASSTAGLAPLTAAHALRDAGRMTPEHVEWARALIERIPGPIRDAARDPFSARAVILAMLLDQQPGVRHAQTARASSADPRLGAELGRLAGPIASLEPELRLPVLEQALQPIASLSDDQTARFRALVEDFIRADDRVDLFEWTLHRLVTRRLEAALGRATPGRVRYYGLARLGGACSVLLSVVARVGAGDEDAARAAFAAGGGRLPGVSVSFLAGEEAGLRRLAKAIDELEAVAPKLKRAVLEACAAAISHDRTVTAREAELYRAIAVSLGVPVPPMVAG